MFRNTIIVSVYGLHGLLENVCLFHSRSCRVTPLVVPPGCTAFTFLQDGLICERYLSNCHAGEVQACLSLSVPFLYG
jgi:hypothetical protein